MLFKLNPESEHFDKLLVTASRIWPRIWEAIMLLFNAQNWMLALYSMTDMMFCAWELLQAVKTFLQQAKLPAWSSHMQDGSPHGRYSYTRVAYLQSYVVASKCNILPPLSSQVAEVT